MLRLWSGANPEERRNVVVPDNRLAPGDSFTAGEEAPSRPAVAWTCLAGIY
jgi:hypothetical protein